MVKSTELRIGNWVTSKLYKAEDYIKVSSINKDGIELDASGAVYVSLGVEHKENDLGGIPITDEILEKCGFEKDKAFNIKEDSFLYFTKPGFDDLKDYGDQGIRIYKDGHCSLSFGYYGNEVYFDHLHQLQNLYFALTQSELPINL